ncbi:hypothetical protein [Halobacterium zhouii]|uniref:hypothetical protein n=1 Tax=Halobacterium zhouii TaxID=2902624 RepID=UPI001E5E3273|nr:hypothetical protein [Halobacterium zhouii]
MTSTNTTNDSESRTSTVLNALKGAVVWVGSWFKAHVLLLFIVSTAFVGTLEYIGVQTGVPSAVAPYTVYLALGATIGYYPSKALLDWLENKFGVPLHDVDPATGDAAGYILSQERWENLTVEAPHAVDEDGDVLYKTVDKDQLHNITTKFGTGYECTDYDSEANTARTSWMAGSSPNEIRAFKKTLKRVETTLSVLADLGIEESMNRTPIVREITEKLGRYLVMCHQQGTVPNGDEINGVITETLNEQTGSDWTTIEDKVQDRLPDEYAVSNAAGNTGESEMVYRDPDGASGGDGE